MRSIFSSFFTRACAWRARVPARKRSTNRSRRSISASCFSIARPSASSRDAFSLRQACQVPLKKRARPASSSSTEVPTASRNQRSWATSTTAASRLCRCALEPFQRLDVEVVGGLVEQQEVGVAGQRAGERGAGQLTAAERREAAVEVLVAEAEAVQRRVDALAPVVAAGVLEPRLRAGVGVERRAVGGAVGHRVLELGEARLEVEQVLGSPTARSRAASGRGRAAAAGRAARSRTSLAKLSSPPSTEVSPASIRSSVVLPAPLRPDSVIRSRRSSRKETPRRSGSPTMSLARSEAMTTATASTGRSEGMPPAL